jgi:hypothetical protein
MYRNADIAHLARRPWREPGRLNIESLGLSGLLWQAVVGILLRAECGPADRDTAISIVRATRQERWYKISAYPYRTFRTAG